jgi:hypothetical protein
MPEQTAAKVKRQVNITQARCSVGNRSHIARRRDVNEMAFSLPPSSKQKSKGKISICRIFDSSRIVSPLLEPKLLKTSP